MLKKMIPLTLAALLATGGLDGAALAAKYPIGSGNNVNLYVNDTLLQPDQPAILKNGRTLVPLRAIFEALGADVQWDGATQTVSGTKGGKRVQLQVNATQAKVNDQTVALDVPAEMINNRTMVPVRFIAESLGAYVGWDGRTSSVFVSQRTITSAYAVETYTQTIMPVQKEFLQAASQSDAVMLQLIQGEMDYQQFRINYDTLVVTMIAALQKIRETPLPEDPVAAHAVQDMIAHWSRLSDAMQLRGALISESSFDQKGFEDLSEEWKSILGDYETQKVQYQDLIKFVEVQDVLNQ